MSKITSIATAVPNHKHLQDSVLSFADSFYAENEDSSRKLRYINRQCGISTRYSVLPDYSLPVAERIFYITECDEPLPNMERRMEVFENDAATLSVSAIKNCIDGKIKANEITH